MHEVAVCCLLVIVLLAAAGGIPRPAVSRTPGSGAAVPGTADRAQAAGPSEKAARTPAQRKINSQLLYEIYRRRKEAARKGIPPEPTSVRIDRQGRALVDVRGDVTSALQTTIRALGGVIISKSAAHHSIIARVPLLKLERLAEEGAVTFIEPAAEATTVRPPGRNR
jgi:hypothetical protein